MRDALEPAHVAALQGLLQGVHAQKVAEGRFEDEDIWQAVFSRSNDLQLHEEVVRLLTHDRVLPKIVDIMGTNIYCWCSSSSCSSSSCSSSSYSSSCPLLFILVLRLHLLSFFCG